MKRFVIDKKWEITFTDSNRIIFYFLTVVPTSEAAGSMTRFNFESKEVESTGSNVWRHFVTVQFSNFSQHFCFQHPADLPQDI